MPGRAVVVTLVGDIILASGARVRWHREQTGKSLRAVAEEAGVSPCLISRWERGVGDPGLSRAAAVARVLGVSLDELLGETRYDS